MSHPVQLIEAVLDEKVIEVNVLHGGDINEVYVVRTGKGTYALKLNDAEQYPNMLKKEAEGLQEMAEIAGVHVPEVVKSGDWKTKQYLILSFIDSDNKNERLWEKLGQSLVALHRKTTEQFGWHTSNYIGSLNQANNWCSSWTEFWITQRMMPQVKLAVDGGIVTRSEWKQIEAIAPFCDEIWPVEAPAFVHGDLWSGNFMAGQDAIPYLIDPAVYYGHRETDIGMMHLFGGFSPLVFEVYNANFPLEKGWEDRIVYNQIYPLLVHLNLFGRGYWSQIQTIVAKFS